VCNYEKGRRRRYRFARLKTFSLSEPNERREERRKKNSDDSPSEKPIFELYEGDFWSPFRSQPETTTLLPEFWFQYTICFAPLVQPPGLPSHQTGGLGAATGVLLFDPVTRHLKGWWYILGWPHLLRGENLAQPLAHKPRERLTRWEPNPTINRNNGNLDDVRRWKERNCDSQHRYNPQGDKGAYWLVHRTQESVSMECLSHC
jgi:hypothetical protein